MLVRDYTPVYSPLGRWAGRRLGGWEDILTAGINATGQIVGGIAGAVASGNKTQTQTSAPPVQYTSPNVSSGGTYNPPQQVLPQKKWYEDPLTLGAAGLAVVGLGAVLLGGRGRRMNGYGSYSRRRRSRR